VADTWARSADGVTPEQYRWWPWGGFWLSPPTPGSPALGQPLKIWQCTSDSRSELVQDYGSYKVAFTSYLGVGGIRADSGGDRNGVLTLNTKVKIQQISDGTSNTLLVGERPPSNSLYYGWWFAGAGWDGSGEGDVILGARSSAYATSSVWVDFPACANRTLLGLQPGLITNDCDATHFFSLHSGGANFLFGDGAVRFMSYSADAVLPALSTRTGGEVVPNF
jgi:prepilin-type processing-associated H-X9-DG protein